MDWASRRARQLWGGQGGRWAPPHRGCPHAGHFSSLRVLTGAAGPLMLGMRQSAPRSGSNAVGQKHPVVRTPRGRATSPSRRSRSPRTSTGGKSAVLFSENPEPKAHGAAPPPSAERRQWQRPEKSQNGRRRPSGAARLTGSSDKVTESPGRREHANRRAFPIPHIDVAFQNQFSLLVDVCRRGIRINYVGSKLFPRSLGTAGRLPGGGGGPPARGPGPGGPGRKEGDSANPQGYSWEVGTRQDVHGAQLGGGDLVV